MKTSFQFTAAVLSEKISFRLKLTSFTFIKFSKVLILDALQISSSVVSSEVVVQLHRRSDTLCSTGSAEVHGGVGGLHRLHLQGRLQHRGPGGAVLGAVERSFNARRPRPHRVHQQLHPAGAGSLAVPEHVVELAVVLVAGQSHRRLSGADENRGRLLDFNAKTEIWKTKNSEIRKKHLI